ncbi:MAG: GFA family protein [Chromatiales bacterium]|nr:GFA family protein [Chromatiales bacterium]
MSEHHATGSCLCGTVRYELRGPFSHMGHCHCSICRKHHGAPFATFVASPLDGYRVLSGSGNAGRYDSSPVWHRPFCLTCGSVLPTLMPEHGLVVGPAGNLEGDLGTRPAMHMFVGSKAPWYEITDGLPQHDAYPPDGGLPEAQPLGRALLAPSPGCTSGSCACGKVAFEYSGAPLRMLNCHCSRCRRGRSAAHTTNIFVPLDRFRFTRGEDLVRDFRLPGARFFGVAFCTACGSDVARKSVERQAAVIPAGSLDSDPGMRPTAHIYVGSKAAWFDITDALPQFAEMPD